MAASATIQPRRSRALGATAAVEGLLARLTQDLSCPIWSAQGGPASRFQSPAMDLCFEQPCVELCLSKNVGLPAWTPPGGGGEGDSLYTSRQPPHVDPCSSRPLNKCSLGVLSRPVSRLPCCHYFCGCVGRPLVTPCAAPALHGVLLRVGASLAPLQGQGFGRADGAGWCTLPGPRLHGSAWEADSPLPK